MATSPTYDTSNTYVKYNITVNVNSQNISNNTSNITVTVRFWRTNTGYETYGTGSCYCWIETVGAQTQAVTSSQRITNSGSIYMSISSINPSALFGGTWTEWGAGRVAVGVASSGTFNTVEKTGGAETVTLTTSQIPAHQHSIYARVWHKF